MRKICVVTGTRAEYGIMSDLMRLIAEDDQLELQIIATNMHFSPEFGLTYQEIEKDGFHIDKKVEMLLSSVTANGIVKSMGVEMMGVADALDELAPDLMVILGDRYEMLVVAQAALMYRIPVAHLYGGEVTEGACDDAIRHAITKLSHLHFTSTEAYRQRVIQMGEHPERVFWVGALGIDNIRREEIIQQEELEESLGFILGEDSLLITFHPVTMENNTAETQCRELLAALEGFKEYKLLFTLANSDVQGQVINGLIRDFVNSNPGRAKSVASLGKKRYYAALRYVTAVVGNSSSGLVEAPCFGKPVLNIGDRQKGRVKGKGVVDCLPVKDSIAEGLRKVLSPEFREEAAKAENPYEKPGTLKTIFEILKRIDPDKIIRKSFYDQAEMKL